MKLRHALSLIRSGPRGGQAMARLFDITSEASFAGLIDSTAREFGGLDGLFNVARPISRRKPPPT